MTVHNFGIQFKVLYKNHKDKYEIPCPTREAYCCFAVTGEQRRELRWRQELRQVRGERRERERELNDSDFWEKRLNLYPENLKT